MTRKERVGEVALDRGAADRLGSCIPKPAAGAPTFVRITAGAHHTRAARLFSRNRLRLFDF